MNKQKIITGIKVSDQMKKAKDILNHQILPMETLYQDRKKNGLLSKELKINARFDNHRRM